MPRRPVLTNAIASCLIGALAVGPLGGCASAPRRAIANEPTPLETAQLRDLGELGIGILRLSVLANSVSEEARLQAQLTRKLDELEAGRRTSMRSVGGTAAISGTVVSLALLVADSVDGGASLIARIHSSTRLQAPQIESLVLNAGISSLVVAAGGIALLAAADSRSGSGSLRGGRAAKSRRETSEAEWNRLRNAFDRRISAITALYADIFNLPFERRALLRTRIVEAARREAEAGQDTVRLDIPKLMLERRLITDGEYIAFRTNVGLLEGIANVDEATLREVLSQERYAENAADCKRLVTAYVDWLESIRASLSGETATQVDRAMDAARRLLARI